MVKVGLIGIGFMGHTHYQIYKNHRRARLVALADYNREKLAGDFSSIGGNVGETASGKEDLSAVNTTTDPMKLIADPEVELVDICLPTDLHYKVALAALKSGKHVFLEKPMAQNVQQAAKLATAAARSKGYFMVGHCIRFWPEYEVAHNIVTSGRYGRVREVLLERSANPPMWGDKDWLMNAKRSGGAALDLQIHDADFALHLLGKPKRVYAWGDKGPSKGIDVVHAALEYPRNVRVTIVTGWIYHGTFPFNMAFRIRCEKATIQYDMGSGQPMTVYTASGKEITPKVPAGSGWERELGYFIKCIEKKTRPTVVTAKSSLESVKLVEAELKSIKTARAVKYK